MPLPPYITHRFDRPERYQTVYSNEPGSAAAPTAGLHFTPELLDGIAAMGVPTARVELVVGLDTFKPVNEADPRDHLIHSERYRVTPEVVRAVPRRSTRDRGRAPPAFAPSRARRRSANWRAVPACSSTARTSGRLVDVMMTNFHMPRTTLLMMIDAFVGERWRRLYDTAIAEEYRFFSFGDAMLLDRSLS